MNKGISIFVLIAYLFSPFNSLVIAGEESPSEDLGVFSSIAIPVTDAAAVPEKTKKTEEIAPLTFPSTLTPESPLALTTTESDSIATGSSVDELTDIFTNSSRSSNLSIEETDESLTTQFNLKEGTAELSYSFSTPFNAQENGLLIQFRGDRTGGTPEHSNNPLSLNIVLEDSEGRLAVLSSGITRDFQTVEFTADQIRQAGTLRTSIFNMNVVKVTFQVMDQYEEAQGFFELAKPSLEPAGEESLFEMEIKETLVDDLKYFSLVVDKFNKATVTFHGISFMGELSPWTIETSSSTASIVINSPENGIDSWRLYVRRWSDNTYSLDQFYIDYPSEKSLLYTFQYGNRITYKYFNDGFGNRDEIYFDYVKVGDDFKVKSKKISRNGNYTQKYYYGYSEAGLLNTLVYDLERSSNYETYDEKGNLKLRVSAIGLPPYYIHPNIESLEHGTRIDSEANYKEEYIDTYSIESTRTNNSWFSRFRRLNATEGYLVRGQVDQLSDETDDLYFKNGQTVEGYQISYGNYYEGNDYKGYGLKFVKDGSSTFLNDYPLSDEVVLENRRFKINLDQNGMISLIEIALKIDLEIKKTVLDFENFKLKVRNKEAEISIGNQTVNGIIDPENLIVSADTKDEKWILTVKVSTDGSFYLENFITTRMDNSKISYTFSEDHNLIQKKTTRLDHDETYDFGYVKIGDKFYVESEIVKDFDGDLTKNFSKYLTGSYVEAPREYFVSVTTKPGGFNGYEYYASDSKIYTYSTPVLPQSEFDRINSAQDYSVLLLSADLLVVSNYARTEFVEKVPPSNVSLKNDKFYWKDKYYYKNSRETGFIVRGKGIDSIWNESDDVFFKNNQMVDGYEISFGRQYANPADPLTYLGYGLGFTKDGVTTLVPDFPNNDVVDLGHTYKVSIDSLGIVNLYKGPSLDAIGAQNLKENSLHSLILNAEKGEGDWLTYRIISVNLSTLDPRTNLPKGASFDPQTNTLNWVPEINHAGTYSFIVEVSDGIVTDRETVQFTVENVNQAPTAIEQRFDVNPEKGNYLDIILSGIDLDGNTLKYEITKNPRLGTLSVNPSNPTRVKYIPFDGTYGLDSFNYKVFDGTDWSDETRILIDLVEKTPVGTYTVLPIFKWLSSQQNSVSGSIDVIDGNPIDTYTMVIEDSPDHGTFEIIGSNFTYKPNDKYYGNDFFTFRARNNRTGVLSSIAQSEIHGVYGLNQNAAVIDSGIDYMHPALGGGLGPEHRVVDGYDFTESDLDPMDDRGDAAQPEGSHGTHVAGIIASDDSIYTGIAPLAGLVGLRIFSDTGSSNDLWLEQALQWVIDEVIKQRENAVDAIEDPITSVNLSLGYSSWNSDSGVVPSWAKFEDEFIALHDLGIFVSVSAGNAFNKYFTVPGLSYPASSPYVIPVMSVDSWSSGLSFFSQRNEAAIGTDGRNVVSTVPDYVGNKNGKSDDFASYSGTSMASPFLAGASMLVREILEFFGNENLNQDLIYEHMRKTADAFYDVATKAHYLRFNLDRAIDVLFNPTDYDLDFSYLDLANIKYGLPAEATLLSSLVGLGARMANGMR